MNRIKTTFHKAYRILRQPAGQRAVNLFCIFCVLLLLLLGGLRIATALSDQKETADNWEFDPESGLLTLHFLDSQTDGIRGFPWDSLRPSVRALQIGPEVKSLPEGAFENFPALTQVHFSAGLTEIGSRAFAGCRALTEVNLPEGLLSLGDRAFLDCESLQSIVLPGSLKELGVMALAKCRQLASAALGEGIQSSGQGTFYGCEALYDIFLPSSLTQIEDECFFGCRSLRHIQLPDGLTEIAPLAFAHCVSLQKITFPIALRTVGGSAFRFCRSLRTLEMNDSLTDLGSYAFAGCALESLTLRGTFTILPAGCFADCLDLRSADLTSVALVSAQTFSGCSSLETLSFSALISGIEESAFSGCTALRRVSYSGSQTSWERLSIAAGNEPLTQCEVQIEIPASDPDKPNQDLR